MFSTSVDSIVEALNSTVTKLDVLAQRKDAEVNELNDKANVLLADASVAGKERDRARRIGDKINQILA